jgi:S1-C subfamily serine protease
MNFPFVSSRWIFKLAAGAGALLVGFSPTFAIAMDREGEPRQTSSAANQQQLAQAQATNQTNNTIEPATEINDISHKTTLLIFNLNEEREPNGHGSGALIAKEGNTCVGVTNRHVILSENQEKAANLLIRTYDGEVYEVNEEYWFESEDLAVVEFECDRNYEPIAIATYQLSPGQTVYLSGWPPSLGDITRKFTSGSISEIRENPVQGYAVGYTNVTQGGMSGGQVLDAAGRLVAIHGLGDRDDRTGQKTGFNYGIPVSTLLARLSQNGSNYSYNISYSPPQEPANGEVVQSEPVSQTDSRDRISTDNVLDKANRVLDTLERVCGFFGC